MAYVSRSNRAGEFANKTNHSHIINDGDVKRFLENCELPKEGDEIKLHEDGILAEFEEPTRNPIKYVITVDGGYTEVDVKKSYPSSKLAFFQFGAFLLNLDTMVGEVSNAIKNADDLIQEVSVFDVYQDDKLTSSGKKSVQTVIYTFTFLFHLILFF